MHYDPENLDVLLDEWQTRHNIKNLTTKDIATVLKFERDLEQKRKEKLAQYNISDHYKIQNKKALGAVVFAGLGFLIGGGFTGAAIGFSIWRKTLGKDKNKTQQEDRERNTTTSYGIDSAAEITPIGGVIALIYCDRSINPRGGVRAAGKIINSRVDTQLGAQRLYSLQSLCLGPIRQIDHSSLRINDSPSWNFYRDEVQIQTRLGYANQANFEWFPYYSRCISPQTNTGLGIDKRGETQGNVASNVFTVGDDDFDSFSPDGIYKAGGQEFTATYKDSNRNQITANRTLTLSKGEYIYAVHTATYETLEACSGVEANIVFSAWAEELLKDGGIKFKKHGYAWDVYVSSNNAPFVRVVRLYVSNKSKSNFRRFFRLSNLPFTRHTFHFVPVIATGGVPVYKLGDVGQTRIINTGVQIGNKTVYLTVEQTNDHRQTDSSTNSKITYQNKDKASSDQGPPIRITTINEIVLPSDIGQPRMIGYPKQVLLATLLKASERISSSPKISIAITRGKVIRFLQAAGTMSTGSGGSFIRDFGATFSTNYFPIQAGESWIINLTNGYTARVASVNNASDIVARETLIASPGDEYLIFKWDSTCFLPDVAADLLIDNEYGRGESIDWKTDIDYPSFIKSKIFCAKNQLYWDGVITERVPWKEFVYTNAVGSLLYPSTVDNKHGLIPEEIEEPVGIYHTGNTLDFRWESNSEEPVNTVIVTYLDGQDLLFKEKTVVIQTNAAYYGSVNSVQESLRLESCRNITQAVKVGQVYLKSRLIGKNRITFRVGLEGIRLRPGSIIIASHEIVERGAEVSGYVMNSTRSGSDETLQLSTTVKPTIRTWSHEAALKNLETGQVITGIRGESVQEDGINKVKLYNVPWALQSPQNNRVGDYVVINASLSRYRVTNIVPQWSNATIQITADSWDPDIFSSSGLVTVY